MPNRHFRKAARASHSQQPQLHVLLLDDDIDYTALLKQQIESRLPASVTIVHNIEGASQLLKSDSKQFFIGITSVLNLDSSSFEKIVLMGSFNLSVIALVNEYEDAMREKLIEHRVIDYVAKNYGFEDHYLCDLIWRIYKNSKIKALVVDDSRVSRFVVARELALQKFNVIQADSAKEALKTLEKNPDIKMVLVDQQMPHEDGTTFVAKAREFYSKDELLIIGLSSSIDPRLIVKFLKAGANDFIAKPFNYEILLARINQNLDMLDAVDLAKEISNRDFLSGLYNRRYFFEQGNKALKYLNHDAPLTVMMVDIDFFKKVNDLYGHEVGDGVIKNIAAKLKEFFPDDIVARMGGEEFAVLSKSPQYQTNFDNIEAFRLSIYNQLVEVNKQKLQYTCSVGVCNVKANDLVEMLAQADKNLYMAKRAGRNQVYGMPS